MTSRLRMYGELAPLYDAQYHWKDYRGEVRRLEEIVHRYGRSRGVSWLDVACGTGRHLELLRPRHDCVGVDASPQMLKVARRRLPGVPLVRGDMRTFRLGRQFDVVSCLFSAIGQLTTEAAVRRALANFARHLKPGGVMIVEPWIDPARAKAGHIHLTTYEDTKTTLVRLAFSAVRGQCTVIRYCYLVGRTGKGIQYLEETDRGVMVPPARLQEIVRAEGLTPRFLSRGFTSDRGLLLGFKPARS